MNKTLANTVGSRIKYFDGLENSTVEVFNNLFPECPLKNWDLNLMVEIGPPASNNCRYISIQETTGSTATIQHKMYSDILYTLDKEESRMDDLELDEMNGVML